MMSRLGIYRIFKLRQRHLLTRQGRLRLRYICSTALVLPLSLSLYNVQSRQAHPILTQDVAHVAALSDVFSPDNVICDADYSDYGRSGMGEMFAGMSDLVNAVSKDLSFGGDAKQEVAFISQSGVYHKTIEIEKGETLAGALQKEGVSGAEAYRAVKAVGDQFDVRKIKAGQRIALTLLNETAGTELRGVEFRVDPLRSVVAAKDEHGRYLSVMNEKDVVITQLAKHVKITNTLYVSGEKHDVPRALISDLIKIYATNVDFQRDLRRDDTLDLFYDVKKTEDGEHVGYGDILYANLSVRGQEMPIYRYEHDDGEVGYYREDGTSLKRTLMRTPVEGARQSSGFGMRRHPVLGYNKMHKGVDYAAPTGTPIYAAGDGIVERASRNGGYGNYIRIRHNGELKTAYAHLHRYAKNMREGLRVKQGDVIGYVGSTGRSTGPHLHFEVIKNGQQINPRDVKSTVVKNLSGQELRKFKQTVASVKNQFSFASQGLNFAQVAQDESQSIR